MTVYELKIGWSCEYGHGNTTEIYSTEEKARKAFNFEIIQAMQDYPVFDEQTGELINNEWELGKGENVWYLFEKACYARNHCTITITQKNVF